VLRQGLALAVLHLAVQRLSSWAATPAPAGIAGSASGRWAVAPYLQPTPQLDMADRNPDATLDHARTRWISPDRLADLVMRWLLVAAGEPKAADTLAQWARCASFAWQADDGLTWAERDVDGRYGAFANRCWFFTDRLGSLRENGLGSSAAAVVAALASARGRSRRGRRPWCGRTSAARGVTAPGPRVASAIEHSIVVRS